MLRYLHGRPSAIEQSSGTRSTRKAALSMRGDGEKTAVILDRHPLWLEALENLLRRVDVTVLGKTTSPSEALEMIEESHPTVFITEYDSIEDVGKGLGVLKRAVSNNPAIHSVVLSTENDPGHIEAAFA